MVKILTNFIMLFILAVIFLVGCQAKEKTGTNQQVQQTKSVGSTANDPKQGQKWTKLSELEVDLDTDAADEKIELLTTAGRDDHGSILWDDGQEWLLVIEDGTKFYPLFSEYVQLGSVYFTVAKEEKIVVTVIISTNTNLRLENYVYDAEQQVYQEESVYSSPFNNYIFTSIPSYK